MDTQLNFRLLRLKEVLHLTGISSSTHYLHIQQGLMVKPVSLGANSSAYPLFEIETINAARIAGKDQNEIKKLVTTLMENRINII
ncbi:transcriptional regulator [Photobacterium phosphoreum]|uniref:helix-turn-helix transcriptional regulator n=1 Tax=Photobacterium phosphoreum TaxID=659 RepID=UPI000D158BE3|nr:AlpA family phage regulatory protein [Photobacterium phosphoreum]PSW30447.1 transcriptional regulator [Photobacterium phosphoreum]